jgi:iron(III) transport system permease protein
MLIYIEYGSRKQQRYYHAPAGYSPLVQKKLHGGRGIAAMSVCVLPVLAGFLIPLGYLIKLTMLTYRTMLNENFFRLFWNSLWLAGFTAVVATFLALFMSYGKRREPNPLVSLAVNLTGMGYAIPGIVIAVGVMMPFSWIDKIIDSFMRTHFNLGTGLLLSGTLAAVIFAYMVRFLAVSLKTVDAGLAKIKPSLEEAGRSAGLNSLNLIRKIHIPMLRGSLLAAVLLVFVDVLKELPATLILRPFDFNTLAIRAYELANEERLADAACPSLAIVLAGILPVIYLSRSISISRPGHDQRA